MPRTVATRRARMFRGFATSAAALAAAGLLAACSTSDTTGAFSQMFGKNKSDDIPQEYFLKQGYCPQLRVRGGTQTLALYERGHEAEPDFITYQASITKTARECTPTVDGVAIKVGVAGRLVAGPKGGAGNVTLPIRVVVTKQSSGVVYSQLFKVPAAITPPNLNAGFSHVVPGIAVPLTPDERDVLIYVGFDEGQTS